MNRRTFVYQLGVAGVIAIVPPPLLVVGQTVAPMAEQRYLTDFIEIDPNYHRVRAPPTVSDASILAK